MALDKKKVQLIQIAKRRLGLSDEQYRNLLFLAAGVKSSKDLSADGFSNLMEIFKELGFQSDFAQSNIGHRDGMATPPQIALIKDIWGRSKYGETGERGLERWLEEHFNRSALRFLERAESPRVIKALKDLQSRAPARKKSGS